MKNKITVFENPEFGEIRSLLIEGEPWFVAKDVASALGYLKPENAIAMHVDDEDKTSTLIQGTGSNYKSKTKIINESGIYSLVFSSKLPAAKRFKRWVTSVVLPSIRKEWCYSSYSGQIIRDTRKSIGITQRDLSHNAGVDRTHLSHMENDRTDPRTSTFFRIVDGMNCVIKISKKEKN